MFSFRHVVKVSDATIGDFIRMAHHFGIEEANWNYQWLDGGRIAFSFDTEDRYNAFRMLVLLYRTGGLKF